MVIKAKNRYKIIVQIKLSLLANSNMNMYTVDMKKSKAIEEIKYMILNKVNLKEKITYKLRNNKLRINI